VYRKLLPGARAQDSFDVSGQPEHRTIQAGSPSSRGSPWTCVPVRKDFSLDPSPLLMLMHSCPPVTRDHDAKAQPRPDGAPGPEVYFGMESSESRLNVYRYIITVPSQACLTEESLVICRQYMALSLQMYPKSVCSNTLSEPWDRTYSESTKSQYAHRCSATSQPSYIRPFYVICKARMPAAATNDNTT
jgi:hypothetical protein